jgi:hypothetical protein
MAAPAMAAPAEVVSPLPTVAPPAATSIPTPTPTVAPTATPTPLPAATATVAATVASVAIEQAAPDARILPTVATRPRSAPVAALPWLPIAQLVATAGFLLFGLLWWRSRR